MKGGQASATVIITVGAISKYRISGTVTNTGGCGVVGGRVRTGALASSAWSDSNGTYALTNLESGSLTGYAEGPAFAYTPSFSNPVSVGPNATSKNFFQSNQAPTVATPANASPATVTAKTTTLTVLGADDNPESALTYRWQTTGSVPATVSFSVNNSNAAKSTVATFSKAGSYPMLVTITDAGGLTVTSAKTVTVNQTYTSILVSPASISVAPSGKAQFTGSRRDQFNNAMASQSTMSWSVSGGGTVSSSGLFTAGSTLGGPHTLTARNSTKKSTATITIAESSNNQAEKDDSGGDSNKKCGIGNGVSA
jgi:hypothetical protein